MCKNSGCIGTAESVSLTPRSQAERCHWQWGVKQFSVIFSKVFLLFNLKKQFDEIFDFFNNSDPFGPKFNHFDEVKVLKIFTAIFMLKKLSLCCHWHWQVLYDIVESEQFLSRPQVPLKWIVYKKYIGEYCYTVPEPKKKQVLKS